ncbi:serine carboxypeptidase-like 50 [Phalaenopsis equestris]|uniref:serine carboxypeptidase-like 50 n=1 Tax=Phalaenopsis equestris TaxID=78828 RepID=UPI0009E3C13F|nr:serine carboxypeptidase-like 50 [Phalaenopsis equestris]
MKSCVLLQDLAAKLTIEGKWSAATDARNRVLTRLKKDTGLATLLNIKKKHKYATSMLKKFLNKDEVKSVLGVGKTTAWVRCNKLVKNALHEDVMKSVKTMVEDVVRKTRVLLYEGALDLKDGVLSVEAWVREMEWEGTPRFLEATREEWRVEGEVAGTVQSWGNLTHVVVLGAGHLAAADRRMNTQAMIEGWVLQSGSFFGK